MIHFSISNFRRKPGWDNATASETLQVGSFGDARPFSWRDAGGKTGAEPERNTIASAGSRQVDGPHIQNKQNLKYEETEMTPAQDRELAKTITEIGEVFASKTEKMQADIDRLEIALGRVGAPQGGGGSSRGNGTNAEHVKAFDAFLRTGENTEQLRKIENSLSTVVDPSGGYLVPDSWHERIERQQLAEIAMRRICNVISKRGQYKRPMSKGGTQSGWVGELEDRTETDGPELSIWQPAWKEIYAMPGATQAIVDDSEYDLEAFLLAEISDSFIEKEGSGFIDGDGVQQVRGFLSYDMVDNASWTDAKIGYVTSGLADSISADSLRDLKTALKPGYRRGGGIWVMNDETVNIISKFRDGEGRPLWTEGLQSGDPDKLLGFPIEVDEGMPDVGAGEYPIAFGNWKRGYTIVDHAAGIRTLRDPFSKKGWIFWYTTKRLTAGVSDYKAIKLLKVSA